MQPILSIARFEFRYHLRQPAFYLFAALIFGQGIWYADHNATLYPNQHPATAAYFTLSSLGVVLAIAAVLLAGQSLTKDLDYRVAPYLYTLPITGRMHFAGRFLGTYATTLLLAVFYPLGTLLLPVLYPAAGPVPWSALVDSFVCLLAQNLFIVVSLTFSLTIFLCSIRGAYVALFLIVLYFLLTETSTDILSDSDIWQLLDPFGVGMMRASIDAMYQTPDELLSMSDMLLINRILWLGLALGVLSQAEIRFSFDAFANARTGRQARPLETANPPFIGQPAALPGRQTFGGWAAWQTLWRVSRLEFLNLARQPVFQLTTGLLILLTVLLATVFSGNPDFPELPITSRMTALRLPLGMFIGLFVLIMTGELIFHERTSGFWPIYDALPQPAFVLVLAKLLALTGITALLTLVLFLTGIGIQFSHDFIHIDWRLYASDLLMDGFLRYSQLIALGALVAVLANNRLIGHVLSLLIFMISGVIYLTDFSVQYLYLYSFLPGSARYSELLGYGNDATLRPAIHLVWWGLAGLFITLSLGLWNRGVPVGLVTRVGQWKHQAGWSSAVGFIVFSTVLGVGLWQVQQQHFASVKSIRYAVMTAAIPSISGRTVTVKVQYHHSYQVRHMLQVAQSALHRGEQLFGAFPFTTLRISEIPHGTSGILSRPGQISISEKQGWTADDRQPTKLDYIDYLVSREIFKQWLVHRLRPVHQAGDGFVRQSLAEYLALQEIANRYGTDRLKQRLAERTTRYIASQHRNPDSEISLLQSSGNDALERGRAALALTSIGQVWGDGPLSLTIGQFYQRGIQHPASATAASFVRQLTKQLPDSLGYLTTYLREPLWFDFKVGRVANLPNGLTVEIVSSKWRETKPGQRQDVPINDFIPLAVLDQDGHELYHKLVHPNPDERFVSLPTLPGARKVVIDPLGTWPEPNKRDNAKLF